MEKKMKRKKSTASAFTTALCILMLISVITATRAYAQENSAAAEDNAVLSDVDLGETTVTAQKQEENIQEVPISITLLNGQDIEDRKIESVREIADFVPNLMIFQHDSSSANTPTMRGMTAPCEAFTVSSGLYVDGVPVVSSVGFEASLIDIERVEVLKGPQGTIYGKGAEAGVINIITRQPDNEFRAKISAEGGMLLSSETDDPARKSVALNISGPVLEDKIYMGVAAEYYQKDGFIENTYTGSDMNDKEHWFGKIHVRSTPLDDLALSLIVSRLQYDDGAPNMNSGESGAAMFGLSTIEDRKVPANLDGEDTSTNDTQSLKMDYGLSDALTLTSVTTHRLYEQVTKADVDFSSATLQHAWKDSEYGAVTEELRLGYQAGRFKWLIGVYFDSNYSDVRYGLQSDISGWAASYSRDIEGETYAAFANITYPLSEKFNLVAGLRYEVEDAEFKDNVTNLTIDDSWDGLTPKIALEYLISPDIMGYVSASQGYRPGGFNALAVTNIDYINYDSETFWSYEAGIKSAFADDRIIVNTALFYMDITDMQVSENLSLSEAYLTNAAEATAIGAELEITARVTKGLTLTAGFGYTDIEFDDFQDSLGNYEGNKNPYAPEYTFNVGAQYRHPSGFYARTDLIGYGEMYFDKANAFSRGSYEIVNAKVGYETEHFDIYLYGKNIFDERYDSDGYYGAYYNIYSDPGEYGLQVVYRF
ncbi:MAG TPA: TonB-dependent receptor [Desulfobacter sp.]|jgi:iron complex outermembrane receptor protein|nr:TonB-dependent receptor [Desulfobacter sp.]